MAFTRAYDGSITIDPIFRQIVTIDGAGGMLTPVLRTVETWGSNSADVGTLTGWLYGVLTIAAGGDILLAHATDPLQTFGDSVYSDGLTVAGAKPKLIYFRNTHASTSWKFVRKTTNGLPLFDTVTAGTTLGPGGRFLWEDPAGAVIGALTTGTNDGLTLSLPGAASTGIVFVLYGA